MACLFGESEALRRFAVPSQASLTKASDALFEIGESLLPASLRTFARVGINRKATPRTSLYQSSDVVEENLELPSAWERLVRRSTGFCRPISYKSFSPSAIFSASGTY
jgi:hypothetical protein